MSDITTYETPTKTTINEDSFLNEIINDGKAINSDQNRYQNLSFVVT